MDRATIKTGYKLDRWETRAALLEEIGKYVKIVALDFNQGKHDAQAGNHMMALGKTLANWDEKVAEEKRKAEEAAKAKIEKENDPDGVAEALLEVELVNEANVWQKYGKTRIYFGRKAGYIELKNGKWESVGANTEVWQACLSEKEYVDHVKSIAYANAPETGHRFEKDIDLDALEIPERKVVLNK